MKALFRLWACVLVGAAVAGASEFMEESGNNRPFSLFTMHEDSVDYEKMLTELGPKLAFAKTSTRQTLIQDGMEVIENCFEKAALMSRYVIAQRRTEKSLYQPSSKLGKVEAARGAGPTASATTHGTQAESYPVGHGEAAPGTSEEPLGAAVSAPAGLPGQLDEDTFQEFTRGSEPTTPQTPEYVGSNWALFNFTFQPTRDDRIQYMEDLAWAVKDVVDVYDQSPLCKKEILKRESRAWRYARKLRFARMTKKSIFELVLSIALHKALLDWADHFGKTHLFTGEEIPLLVATAREANTKRRALQRLNKSLGSSSYMKKKSRQMQTVLVNQYISTHIGRASELALSSMWVDRYPPAELRRNVSEGDATLSESGVPLQPGENAEDADELFQTARVRRSTASSPAMGSALVQPAADVLRPQEAEVETTPMRSAEDMLATASLFNILTRSRFPNIASLIAKAEEGTAGEILGYEGHGSRVIETFPCPQNSKKEFINPHEETFGFFKRTVFVYKYTGIRPEGSAVRNEEAVDLLTEALNRMKQADLEKLFLVPPGTVGDVRARVAPLFPTMCFSDKKKAAEHFRIDKKHVDRLVSEVPIRYMKKFPSLVRQFARTETSIMGGSQKSISKLTADARVSTGKLKAVTSFLKAAFVGVGIFVLLGVALVGMACVVGIATATLLAVPACAIAALIFGPWTFFIVATPLTLGAIGLGSLAWTLAVTSSVKSALRFTLGTILMQKREKFLHEGRNKFLEDSE